MDDFEVDAPEVDDSKSPIDIGRRQQEDQRWLKAKRIRRARKLKRTKSF